MIHGGGQERDRRSGTHNVAGIVGMAAALSATVSRRQETVERTTARRDRLGDGLLATVAGTAETGLRENKVGGHLHLRFAGVESEALVILLDQAGVAVSAGAACSSGAIEASHVLTSMGSTTGRRPPASDSRWARPPPMRTSTTHWQPFRLPLPN